ncbi:MAG: glycosyltransferase family 39 protein, partial [Chloroflexi bacterium]|nr:glycosyltransferase family 39 protein [Chloroflexota bacterium]
FLFWQPGHTLRLFWQVLTRDVFLDDEVAGQPALTVGRAPARVMAAQEFPLAPGAPQSAPQTAPQAGPQAMPQVARRQAAGPVTMPVLERPAVSLAAWMPWIWAGLLAFVILLAIQGGATLRSAALDMRKHAHGETGGAEVWFVLAGSLVTGWQLFQSRDWWINRFPRGTDALRRLFYPNDYAWSGGAALVLAMLLLLAGLGVGGPLGAGLLFLLAAAVWLVIVIGNRALDDPVEPVPEQPGARMAIVWNWTLVCLGVFALWVLTVGAGWWLVPWIGGWALLGGVGMWFMYNWHGRDDVLTGVLTGVFAGALGGPLLLPVVWGFLPEPDVDLYPGETSEAQGTADPVTDPEVGTLPVHPRTLGDQAWAWFEQHVARLALVPVALLLSVLAYTENVAVNPLGEIYDIEFTTGGFVAWVFSIVLWVVILAVDLTHVPAWLRDLQRVTVRSLWGRVRMVRVPWALVVLALITALGAYFRLDDLGSTPPDMTSDHIEKLLDAMRVDDGYRGVFFPNNGGREGFQMYMVAWVASAFDVGLSFDALKLATIIEGVITIPALYWMARQIFGAETEQDRQIGMWTGLALAGLVAISSWHVMLSRLGLRIVLTPLTTALVLGFLARAMRHNRTRDYVGLGLTLGAGVYFYQANRMLPLIVLTGLGLALVAQARQPRDLARIVGDVLGLAAVALTPVLLYVYVGDVLEQASATEARDFAVRMQDYLPMFVMVWFSLVALATRANRVGALLPSSGTLHIIGGLMIGVVVALAVYVPMYHYSQLRPDDFWNRTRGRLFGEDAFQRTYEDGTIESYDPTLREQFERFWDERDVFQSNYEDALLMYHWEGDGMWITNSGSRPALGGVTGGLLVLGVVLWLLRTLRQPDPVNWLVPISVIAMLLPSALTLAYTIENPSFTRASGSIPGVMLLAALPLGVFCWRLTALPVRTMPVPRLAPQGIAVGALVGVVVLAGVFGVGYGPNADNFFEEYRLNYSYSWKPYREIAQPLQEFAASENGSYGNAFYVHYEHWLDHRILGAMAGDIRWPNGLVHKEDVYATMTRNVGTPYEFQPGKQLFFMYHIEDEETLPFLETYFPGGTLELYEYSYDTNRGVLNGSFYIYTVQWVPPLD